MKKALAMALLLVAPAFAAKQPLPSVEINGDRQQIKDSIVRMLIPNQFHLVSESGYSLVLGKPVAGARGFMAGVLTQGNNFDPANPPSEYLVFDISPVGGVVLVQMTQQISVKQPLGITDTYDLTDKKRRVEYQDFLNRVKQTVESQPKRAHNAAFFGFSFDERLRIVAIQPGSPMEKAGAQVHDLLTVFNGKPLETQEQLRQYVHETEPGVNIKISLMRGTEFKTLDVTPVPASQ